MQLAKSITAAMVLCASIGVATGQETIRIGEFNSYKAFPSALVPYRLGWNLAVDEINGAGGVLGRMIEVISRDDSGTPGEAVRVAEEMVSRDKVSFLVGTFASHVALAVSDFARQRRVLLIAAQTFSEKVVWDQGHKYVFSVRPNTHTQTAMIATEATKIYATRWAIAYPDYEFGQTAAAAFKKIILEKNPKATFVEFPVAVGKADGGALVQAITKADVDGVFSALFGADLIKVAREIKVRGALKSIPVFGLVAGEPEYLDSLKDDAPIGWYVTGYPWAEIKTPEHLRFVDSYRAKYKDYPRVGSVAGYVAFHALAAAIQKAGSLDTDKVIAAMEGLEIPSPFGPIAFRAADHSSTMGTYIGKLSQKDGKGIMVDWRYENAIKYLPSEDEARRMRPSR